MTAQALVANRQGQYPTANQKKQARVLVCKNTALKVPHHVVFGATDMGAKYETHINAVLDSDTKEGVVLNRTLSRVLGAAVEDKVLVLCECQYHKFHAKVLVKVINERAQALELLNQTTKA